MFWVPLSDNVIFYIEKNSAQEKSVKTGKFSNVSGYKAYIHKSAGLLTPITNLLKK
jgi:hypothetical protein